MTNSTHSIPAAPSHETISKRLGENDSSLGLEFIRVFTENGTHPFDQVEWTYRSSSIYDEKGEVILSTFPYDNLCVFKPEMVHDLPTGSRRIIQKASGYKATIKSGIVTFKDDEATGAMPGSLIRGEQSLQATA